MFMIFLINQKLKTKIPVLIMAGGMGLEWVILLIIFKTLNLIKDKTMINNIDNFVKSGHSKYL